MTYVDFERDVAALRGRLAVIRHTGVACTVLGVEKHRRGSAVVLRRCTDGAELRAYWGELEIEEKRRAA